MSHLLMKREESLLVVIDIQGRLMPAVDQGDQVILNAGRLMDAARKLDVPIVVTEQNPAGLGPTVEALDVSDLTVIEKMTFDSCPAPGFLEAIGSEHDLIVVGCEAHVCVAQTVLGLLGKGRKIYVVEDAVGSRTQSNKRAALRRMSSHGAELVTTEMVVFEWLSTAEHSDFKTIARSIK
ncbi:isochorismatase family protein [Alphaproteobacteria bacterium]|jgi:nicotinamidase-related amidase|nr:isochorismatase family protein [Alphaproteobacteria bacterium]